MSGIVVIGVGNDYRGDDGAGLAVARALRGLPYLEAVENGGDPAELIEAWAGADVAVVVDAARSDPPRPPGEVRRHEGAPVAPAGGATTHALSIADAVALGRALGRLPRRLVVCTVEGGGYDLGAPLTPQVEAAAARLAREIARDFRPSGG